MYRTVLTLLAALLVTGTILANAGPPRGKMVPVEHKITTDKEYPDYNFYLVGEKLLPVKLDPKTPIEFKGKPGDFQSYMLVAVPKGMEKQFDNEDALRKALLVTDKIEGRVQAKDYIQANFRVVETDKRDRIVRESTVDKITAKDGIVLTTKEVAPKKKDTEKKDSPDDGDGSPSAYTPRGGMLIAGLSAFAAMTLGGLWLVGRRTRKV